MEPPKNKYPVLVDGDILHYRISFKSKGSFSWEVEPMLDDLVEEVRLYTNSDRLEFYLTGKGNYRNDIAVTHKYKGNRAGLEKPEHFALVRSMLEDRYKSQVSVMQECDDDIAMRATELDYKCIIASTDKDFKQIPCLHYNLTRREISRVSPEVAMFYFYQQIITGDNVDNIKGIKGLGPKKSEKMLKGLPTEKAMWETCVEAYAEAGMGPERALENARLLWLRRKAGEIWDHP